ncbi:UDP-N-acetylmuramoyl-tripeptide--D-alanyl-D-alanine ligase [Flagellimonas myxillae]|uniref:UDP-N-acetylmuramoyl-tripeptide--D-alanyl-D- alanine ligase n=1 Tax=Flagellimonas myxillae TaxID=2942214 RepID=UPI00201EE791|nr:UDP-N-acetylmuramoyl-tripeptide--D-alanyl-D-alanine ligase [Muricauda myxillae]MCL6264868.1 UDP-N-acetylmuramoyl-tripeptide--D-alanyl-D-alanine ligase [Muricauda myxillae]
MKLEQLHLLFQEHPVICTDTRKITHNCLFFALKGPNFNGNTFTSEALQKGAAYVIIDEEEHKVSEQCIVVTDVLTTLQDLARHHRKLSKAKVIALTGSNGKTTTKELINCVLSKKYNTIATKGNLNNHIGVPLTLLTITKETEIAIVEMGANHQGEIAMLSKIAEPDFGYITNFGKAHLEGFGGTEGVIKGKSELYTHLITGKKSVFMNADDPVQVEKLGAHIKKYGFSIDNPQYFNIKFLEANPFVVLEFEGTRVATQLVGKYNFTNCCAAITMGKYFNVSPSDIKEALEAYQPKNNRSQIIEQGGYKIILDAYNANPTSMQAALENFSSMEATSKTLILGDMFELGTDADQEHQQIADLAQEMGFEHVVLVGSNFFGAQTPFLQCKDFEALKMHLSENPPQKGSLLIKGSRGMALERVLELL